MANVLIGAAVRAVAPTILQKFGKAIAATLEKPDEPGPVASSVIPAVVAAAKEAVHEDPTIAVVSVKPTLLTGDFWARVLVVFAAVLSLIFGRDVLTPDLQAHILAIGLALYGLYEYLRSRRRTSITKAASVNILQKPAE